MTHMTFRVCLQFVVPKLARIVLCCPIMIVLFSYIDHILKTNLCVLPLHFSNLLILRAYFSGNLP